MSDRGEEALRYLAEGLTWREVAARMGVSKSTARRLAYPAEAAASRQASLDWKRRNAERVKAYDDEYHRDPDRRGRCIRCEGLMGIGMKTDGVCDPCRSASRHERCVLIVAWWAKGLTQRQIRERLGWSQGLLSCEMNRMRAQGYDLPYREGYPRPRREKATAC